MTRVSWLLRQLKAAPNDLLICASGTRVKDSGASIRLDRALEKPESLLPDPKFDVKSFTLTLNAVAGTKRGQGKSTFVGSVLELTNRFYESVVQNIKIWTPPAPKVKSSVQDLGVSESNSLDAPTVSSSLVAIVEQTIDEPFVSPLVPDASVATRETSS
jgi:hypothetical protein